MNALQILETIGYTVSFASDRVQYLFDITGVNDEPPSETVWQFVDKHRVEISEALRQHSEV